MVTATLTGALERPESVVDEVDPLLTKADVMQALQVRSNTFANLIASGRLKSVKVGRLRRVRRSDLAAFIAGLTGETE